MAKEIIDHFPDCIGNAVIRAKQRLIGLAWSTALAVGSFQGLVICPEGTEPSIQPTQTTEGSKLMLQVCLSTLDIDPIAVGRFPSTRIASELDMMTPSFYESLMN